MKARSEACRNLKPSGAAPRGDTTQGDQKEERHMLMPVSPNVGPTELGDRQEREEGSKEGTEEETMINTNARKEELQWAEGR